MLLLSFLLGQNVTKGGLSMNTKIIIDVSKESEPVLPNIYRFLETLFGTAIHVENSDILSFPGLEIHTWERRVTVNDQCVPLTAKEFEMLVYLASHPGWVFSKKQLYEEVWKETPEDVDNAVMCLISSLRRKLEKRSDIRYIHTVRGAGYKFEVHIEGVVS